MHIEYGVTLHFYSVKVNDKPVFFTSSSGFEQLVLSMVNEGSTFANHKVMCLIIIIQPFIKHEIMPYFPNHS